MGIVPRHTFLNYGPAARPSGPVPALEEAADNLQFRMDGGDEGRTPVERAFLSQLERIAVQRGRKPRWDTWLYYTPIVITLTIVDQGVVRAIRMDFDGNALVGGSDWGNQIDPDGLRPDDPDYVIFSGPRTPEAFADVAYDWFRQPAARPIDRLEWDGDDHGYFRWRLADTSKELCARYYPKPDRAPDRVIRLPPIDL